METYQLTEVQPVRPVAGYIGGKRNLSARLVAKIDAIDHYLYAEPFVGMGGVFFRRRRRPRVEVINDISTDVTTLFRMLQRHYQAFLDMLKWQLSSRAEFERLMHQDASTLTDLERAARFLYLQKTAFGGKVVGRTYGIDRDNGSRFNLTKLEPMLEEVHDRLAGVSIERLHWQKFLDRYDRPGTLFYLDPPYWGCTDDYGADVFSEADFGALRDALGAINGRFILSINDVPEIRALFAEFTIEPVDLTYRISGKVTAARELIISSITGGENTMEERT
ncbi:DNA adenine methylase [soil metagenome]